MSELSKISSCRFIVCFGRIYLCSDWEKAEMNALSVDPDSNPPLTETPIEMQSSVAASIILPFPVVSSLSYVADYAKIAIGVIERISVFMVAFSWIAIQKAQNLTVHGYAVSWCPIRNSAISAGIESPNMIVPPCKPFELAQFLETMWRYLRKLSLRKRNQAIIFRWGCHFVALLSDKVRGCFSTPQPHFITSEEVLCH